MSGRRQILLWSATLIVLGVVLLVIPSHSAATARCYPAYICNTQSEQRSSTSVMVEIVGWISLVVGVAGLIVAFLGQRRRQRRSNRRGRRSYHDEY
jgi:hypothetical protein